MDVHNIAQLRLKTELWTVCRGSLEEEMLVCAHGTPLPTLAVLPPPCPPISAHTMAALTTYAFPFRSHEN